MKSREIIAEVQDLHMHFPVKGGIITHTTGYLKAVDGVSFSIHKGEVLGLVGENGCGKTTTGRCVLNLYPPTSGKVYFKGKDLGTLSSAEMKDMRQDMQLIFEDPSSTLSPHMRVGDIIAEPLQIHKLAGSEECQVRVAEQLILVHLEPEMAERFPGEFSPVDRRRIEIARALIMRPSFVVCDNPTEKLDISGRAQILDLLRWYQGWQNLTYLYMAHNLGVVRDFCDRVMVMYRGKILETADREELLRNPLHPYTRTLLPGVGAPDPEAESQRKFAAPAGEATGPPALPSGCRFHPRCNIAVEICREQEPELKSVDGDHLAACHRV